MTRPLGLPSTLRTKLAALARRIRLLQSLRGVSLLVLTLVLLLGGLLVVDLLFPLSPLALRIAAIAILGMTALVAVFGVVIPLCRRVDADALAALIEAQYPELGERLTTTVELAGTHDVWHGSRALIELLIEETERRANPLDFGRAFPARLAGWLALSAVVAVLGAGLPALVWGEQYADFGNRLAAAWRSEPVPEAPGFAFQVTPVNGFAAQGRPLNILVLAHPQNGTPASACQLAYTDAENKTVRVRMPAEPGLLPALAAGAVAQGPLGALPLSGPANLLRAVRPGTRAFSYRFDRLNGDLPFHVEIGTVRSTRYTITAIEPVDLAPNSPTVTIAAPAYASKEVHPAQTLSPGSDLYAFEYGSIRLDCSFTRRAVRASLEITPRRENGRDSLLRDSWLLPLPLEGQAVYEVPSLRRGSYDLKLLLEAEHGIKTEYELRPLTVQSDEPPAFTRKPDTAGTRVTEARRDWAVGADPTGAQFNPVRGGLAYDGAREVAPDDVLKLKVTVEDTLGVDKVELEYRVNEGPARLETVAAGDGQLKAEPPQGEYAFQLAGKVKDGDVVLYRLRASDTRRVAKGAFKDAVGRAVPAAALTPHVVYHPERAQGKDRWFILRINRKADPLAKQEIALERDRIRQKLDAIQKKLTGERTQLNKVRNETRNRPQLSPEQKASLNQLRRDNREIRGDLRQLADLAEQTPALRPLADTAQDVADKEMARSDDALTQAQAKKTEAPQREQQLQKADEELARAQKQLEMLKQTNEKLAQQRFDQLKMQNLANQQKELERRAADLAAKNPMQDPQAKRELDELRAEQNQVADELKRLAEQSELFRNALDAARADEAKKLADEAKQLAQAQRDLTQAKEEAFKKETAGKFDELARKQQELAAKATDLAKETAQPAQVANKAPLRPDAAQKAAEAIKQGDLADAVQKQDQSAKELERLAADFDKALELSRDPREAARQLAALQTNLQKRLAEEVKKKTPTPLGDRARQLQPEQEGLQRAVKAIPVPEAMQDAKNLQRQAADRAADAAKALQRRDAAAAKQQMEQAKQALTQLANRLPTLEQRRQQALQQVAEIRRQQEDIGRQTDAVFKQFEKKDPTAPATKAQLNKVLAGQAQRQAQLAERLAKLDMPKEQPRQEKAEKALTKAVHDLVDRPQDVPASQQVARRELDRLEKALRGQQPDDEKAAELARKQKELTAEAAKLAADPNATPAQMKALQDRQAQIARETQALPAKQEAPLQAAAAVKATQQAADTVKAQPKQPATQAKMAEAAQALQKLADQLAGKETDAARAERLAEEQAKVAAAAEKEPGKAAAPAAQQAQREIAQEAKQIRAGEDAQAQKKAATDALAKAQQPGQKPAEQAKAQRAAADALKDLADKLAGRDTAAAKAAELARQQAELAKQAGEKKDPLGERAEQEKERLTELARKAAQKQAELTRQAQRLDAKGAQQAQKQAAEQMAAAQKALDQAKTPADAKEALARAADAADRLAKELAREQAAGKPANPDPTQQTAAKPGEQTPKQAAQQLAQQQKQLAQATQKAAGKPGEAGKQAMQEIAKQQAQLNQQAAGLTAPKAETALQKARQAMAQAQQALQKNNPGDAQRKQQDAARALEQLARQLPDKAPAQAAAKEPAAAPPGLPNKQQADQARQLAQAQKELRDAVQKLAAEAAELRKTQPAENPLGELARKQQDVAKQAAELAKDVAKEQGAQAPVTKQAQEAAQQAQQTAQQAQAGQTPQAQKMGEQLAGQLRKLAQDLNQTPRGNADPKAPDPAQRAAQLAKAQEALNKEMQLLAGNAAAQKAQQDAQQGELAKQTGELAKGLGKLGQKGAQPAQAAQQAQAAMQQAQAQAKQGNEGKAGEAGKQAAQMLEKAAQQAAQAAQQMAGQKPGQPGQPNEAAKQTGEAVQQGQEQVGQAQAKLGQGQPKDAQGAMQKAAAALQQAAQHAAQQMAKANESGQPMPFAKEPGLKGAAGTGLPDLSMFGKEMKKYAGRGWGDLPGELRTRILQDMRARYGEDYAGIIQRYFEQIADTNRARRK